MIWQKVRRALRNPYFARTPQDRAAISIVLIGSHLALWYELWHVLPTYYPKSSNFAILHTVVALVLYVNSLANLYKMARTRTVCDLAAVGVTESPEWPYCERCMLSRPPRTHHCPACDVCVLRRDHHCWFGGCRVGHSNQRYYFCAVLYMLAAAIYANVFHWSFVLDRLGHLGRIGIPICVAIPHVCALFGFLSFYQFLVAALTFIAALLMVMLSWLLIIQIMEIINGQTRHERNVGDETYNNGLTENIRSVFGERWFIAWLSPWIRSPLPENGVVFKVSELKTK